MENDDDYIADGETVKVAIIVVYTVKQISLINCIGERKGAIIMQWYRSSGMVHGCEFKYDMWLRKMIYGLC